MPLYLSLSECPLCNSTHNLSYAEATREANGHSVQAHVTCNKCGVSTRGATLKIAADTWDRLAGLAERRDRPGMEE
jgi:hypothetical protein